MTVGGFLDAKSDMSAMHRLAAIPPDTRYVLGYQRRCGQHPDPRSETECDGAIVVRAKLRTEGVLIPRVKGEGGNNLQ